MMISGIEHNAHRLRTILAVLACILRCRSGFIGETHGECLLQTTGQVEARKQVSLQNVLIVQGDNQRFPNTTSGLQDAIKEDQLGRIQNTLLNLNYAKRHGYDYRRYTFAHGCSHPSIGPLHEYFCKIAILLDAMAANPDADLIWWLDTDALVRNMSIALPEFLENGEVTVSDCKGSGRPHVGKAAIYSWTNKRWGCDANTGSVVLQRSAGADKFLRDWWAETMPFGTDQPPFNKVLVRHKDAFAIFADAPFDNTRGQFVHHRCGNCDWLPPLTSIQHLIAEENGIDQDYLTHSLLSSGHGGSSLPWVMHMEGKSGFEI